MKRTLLKALVFVTISAAPVLANEPLPAVPPIPAGNSMSWQKVELGKMLFFDPRLSSSGVVSCATCHNPSFAFTDRVPRALGHNHQVGPRNTPTVLNAAPCAMSVPIAVVGGMPNRKTSGWRGKWPRSQELVLRSRLPPLPFSTELTTIGIV